MREVETMEPLALKLIIEAVAAIVIALLNSCDED